MVGLGLDNPLFVWYNKSMKDTIMNEAAVILREAGFCEPKGKHFCEIGDISCSHFKSGKCSAKKPSFKISGLWECPCKDEQDEIEDEGKDNTDWKAYRDLCCGKKRKKVS